MNTFQCMLIIIRSDSDIACNKLARSVDCWAAARACWAVRRELCILHFTQKRHSFCGNFALSWGEQRHSDSALISMMDLTRDKAIRSWCKTMQNGSAVYRSTSLVLYDEVAYVTSHGRFRL